jgi:hypothetical protein
MVGESCRWPSGVNGRAVLLQKSASAHANPHYGPNEVISYVIERHEKSTAWVPNTDREWRAIPNKGANSYIIEIAI